MTPEQEERIRLQLATRKLNFKKALILAHNNKSDTPDYHFYTGNINLPHEEYVETVELLLAEVKRLRNEHQ